MANSLTHNSGSVDNRSHPSSTSYQVTTQYSQPQLSPSDDNPETESKTLQTFTIFADLPQEMQVMIFTLAASIGEPLNFIYRHNISYPRCELLHSPGEMFNKADPVKAGRLIGAISILSVSRYFNFEGTKAFYQNNEFRFVRNTQLLILLKRNTSMLQNIRYIAFTDHWFGHSGIELYRLLREAHELREICLMSRTGRHSHFPGMGYGDSTIDGFATVLFRDAFPLIAAKATTRNQYSGVEMFKFHPQFKPNRDYSIPTSLDPTSGPEIWGTKAHRGAENVQLKTLFDQVAKRNWEIEEEKFQKYEKKQQKKKRRQPRKPKVVKTVQSDTHSAASPLQGPVTAVNQYPNTDVGANSCVGNVRGHHLHAHSDGFAGIISDSDVQLDPNLTMMGGNIDPNLTMIDADFDSRSDLYTCEPGFVRPSDLHSPNFAPQHDRSHGYSISRQWISPLQQARIMAYPVGALDDFQYYRIGNMLDQDDV